ncbi:hypothetical protein [Caballeronia sp. DA-9]|uniref:hypothetical protein n=1 Tax=Caballeronia sp. DA-9 TaxID=3436237 RepID=UPI003F673F79
MTVDITSPGSFVYEEGYPGMIYDMNVPTMESKTNEGATTLDFGRTVARGTTADDTRARSWQWTR